jgi:hypothetical protein
MISDRNKHQRVPQELRKLKREKEFKQNLKMFFTGTSILHSPRVYIRGSVVCVIKFVILIGSLIIESSVVFTVEMEDIFSQSSDKRSIVI